MPTIKALELENFMSHRHSLVTFEPGICLITGANRSGKTNLLRALRWVLLGEGPAFHSDPSLDAIRHGAGEKKQGHVRVRVVMSNGAWVERYRSASRNEYTLCYPDGRTETHTAVGTGFYAPVAEITGIFPVDVAGDPVLIGWQGIFDSKMLVGESPSTADKQLTHMVGVNRIEMAARSAEADQRKLSTDAKQRQAEAATLREQIEKFDFLPEAEQKVKNAKEQLQEAHRKATAYSQSSTAAQVIHNLKFTIAELERAYSDLLERTNAAASLLRCSQDAYEVWRRSSEAAAKLAVATRLEEIGENAISSALDSLGRASSLLSDLDAIRSRIAVVRQAVSTLKAAQSILDRDSAALAAAQEEVESAKDAVCPYCGRPGVCPHCGRAIG